MKTLYLIFALLFVVPPAIGQTPLYTFKHSTVPYTNANSLQKISNDSFTTDNGAFVIALPFTFTIDNIKYDTGLVFREGLLAFLPLPATCAMRFLLWEQT